MVQHEVGVVTKLWDGQPKNQGFILDVGEHFYFIHNVQTGSGAH
jgi:hypothetical protein